MNSFGSMQIIIEGGGLPPEVTMHHTTAEHVRPSVHIRLTEQSYLAVLSASAAREMADAFTRAADYLEAQWPAEMQGQGKVGP